MTAIRTNGLTKRYGDVTAIEDVNLVVEEGEVFGFLGPNGAGKSTTIDLLLDYVRPTAGTAEVLGYDAQGPTDAIGRRVGVLPDGFELYDRLTGRRHVELAIETKGTDDDPDELFDRVGLEPTAADRPTGGYSKGMAQRLAMAMALVGDPDLLIMDEPTSGLDPHGIREMQTLVREEADAGATVFFSSHILEHVERVCDRVGVLHDGRLVAVDTIGGLQESLGGGATVTVELDRPVADAVDSLPALEGVTEVVASGPIVEVTCAVPSAKAAVITRLDAAGATVLDVGIEDASLESLFSALTETGGSDRFRRGALDPDADGDASDGDDGALPDREVVA
ncbi:ABC transporter ATP-binding protein [Halovivax sp.]|uniref:ABC transporter ATP-binding protein n=1 Tax=Halovivax sp. TaxID=1935978 RepID=UPI0025C45FA4|nr:ABC transporter ATP-binding protein [Halovivax sp.]